MDDIWFNRLEAYVQEGLSDLKIALENLSQITVLVTEFVDSFQSTLSTPMTSTEKHLLAVTWVDKLMFKYCDGHRLAPSVAKLNSEYISRLCEVSKGRTKLNGADQVFARSKTVTPPEPVEAGKKSRFGVFRANPPKDVKVVKAK